MSDKTNFFGMTEMRGRHTAFGIKPLDRLRHMYVVGKTGMGKSTLLENMAIQDMQNGNGLCFVDPHGSAAEKLLAFVPQDRIKDVIYFAPFDIDYPLGFNVMEDVGFEKRHLVVAGLMSAFKRIWGPETWSARMEYILQNVLLALLEYPDSTLVDVNRMLTNKEYRNKVVSKVTDQIVKEFWTVEFAGYTERYAQEATPAIQNKIGQFVSNPLVRNIIAQPNSTFDIRKIMDEKKIFIVNLSKGRMGEQNADLLGSMLITKMYLSALSRAELPQHEQDALPPFYLYVDEFQSVSNDSFANILAEARKYKLALTIAHQYIEQVDESIRAAVFGNVGTSIVFRVGPFDAQELETLFKPTFLVEDIVNLGAAQIYLSLMIDGIGSRPFSARTLPPIEPPQKQFITEIIDHSRATYARHRTEIEALIMASGILPGQQAKQSSVQQVSEPRRDPHMREGQRNRPSQPPPSSPKKRPYPQAKPLEKQPQRPTPRPAVQAPNRDALKEAIAKAMQAKPAEPVKQVLPTPLQPKVVDAPVPEVPEATLRAILGDI